MNTQQNKTATHNERQSISKQEIIKDIINIFAINKLSIADAKDILYETSKMICRQPVVTIEDRTEHPLSRMCNETPRFSMER